MTTELISFKDLRPVAPGEMGVLDTALAEALGFDRPRDIRKLIERHMDELKTYGDVATVISEPAAETATGIRANLARNSRRGRKAEAEYTLNEQQALLICLFSRTEKAIEVRRSVIEIFTAFRRGRAAASPALPDMTQRAVRHRRLVRDAKIDFARVVARLDDLGIDVASIDMDAVRNFSRQFSVTTH